jgi:hypothetical protein
MVPEFIAFQYHLQGEAVQIIVDLLGNRGKNPVAYTATQPFTFGFLPVAHHEGHFFPCRIEYFLYGQRMERTVK